MYIPCCVPFAVESPSGEPEAAREGDAAWEEPARRLLDSVFPLDVQVDVDVAIQLEHLSAWKLPKHDTLSLSLPSQFGDSDIQVLS